MPEATSIEMRQVGRTGFMLPSFGLGTATLGGAPEAIPEAEARGIVEAAWSAGIRYVDTAPFYGHGKAERVVGDVLRGKEGWLLSTKAGRVLVPRHTPWDPNGQWKEPLPFDPVYDYSYDGIMRSFEASLHRLGLDHIDVLLMHDIGPVTHGEEENARHFKIAMDGGYKAMDELRSSGAVKAIGLGVNEWEVIAEALKHGAWDISLLAGRYTLLEQDPLHTLFPAAEKMGMTIIVGGPFNSGVLVGRDSWNYSRAPQAVLDRAKALGRVCDAHNVPLPAAALAFPLAHPLVTSIIPGPRTVAEFEQVLGWWNTPVPVGLWSDLKAEGLIDAAAPVPAA